MAWSDMIWMVTTCTNVWLAIYYNRSWLIKHRINISKRRISRISGRFPKKSLPHIWRFSSHESSWKKKGDGYFGNAVALLLLLLLITLFTADKRSLDRSPEPPERVSLSERLSWQQRDISQQDEDRGGQVVRQNTADIRSFTRQRTWTQWGKRVNSVFSQNFIFKSTVIPH